MLKVWYYHILLLFSRYLVKVIAANGISSMESEPITIEIQEVIRPIFIGDEVVQRNELVV